jgi:hypothetical protein
VPSQHNLRPEFLGADHGRIKVLHLKPQQHSIPTSQFRIPDGAVMMSNMPAVQLQEQLAIRHQLLVLASPVAALASKKTLVPTTARFDISDTNQGLGTHLQFHCSSKLARSRTHREWSCNAFF